VFVNHSNIPTVNFLKFPIKFSSFPQYIMYMYKELELAIVSISLVWFK